MHLFIWHLAFIEWRILVRPHMLCMHSFRSFSFCPTFQQPHIYNCNALLYLYSTEFQNFSTSNHESILHSVRSFYWSTNGTSFSYVSANKFQCNKFMYFGILNRIWNFYHRVNSTKFWLFVVNCATPIQSRPSWEIRNNGINKKNRLKFRFHSKEEKNRY